MTTKDAKRSSSVSHLPEENSSQVDFFNTKRPNNQNQKEVKTPTITINTPTNNKLAATVEHTQNVSVGNDSRKAEYLAFKSDSLRDKAGRYNSHHLFLTHCISENIILIGLKLEVKPAIGNHDEDFLNKYYKKLQQYSLAFVNYVAPLWNTTNTSLTTSKISKIQNTENELQQIFEERR